MKTSNWFPCSASHRPFARPGHVVQNYVYWLHSGTSKTKAAALFWKSHCAICSPVYLILYHMTGSCKGPIERTTRGVNGHAPGKFLKFKFSETQSGAFLLSWLRIPYSRFCVMCSIEIFRILYTSVQVNIQ